jgi:uncharacterized protein (TIGR00251 family)
LAGRLQVGILNLPARIGELSFRRVSLPGFIRIQEDGATLRLKLQPRASKNEIGQPLGDELRVKVTAPPVDAAANEALIKLLSETLDWPRNRIQLIRGHASRHKEVKVYGIAADVLLARMSLK